jgi:hypothetical protein
VIRLVDSADAASTCRGSTQTVEPTNRRCRARNLSLQVAGGGFEVKFLRRRCSISKAAISGLTGRPEAFHLRALPKPYVNLSIHTAPDVRPLPWHRGQWTKRCGFGPPKPAESLSCPFGLMARPLKLATCPSNDPGGPAGRPSRATVRPDRSRHSSASGTSCRVRHC